MEQTKQDNLALFLSFIYIFWFFLVLTIAVHYFDVNFGAMFQTKTAIYFVVGLIIAIFIKFAYFFFRKSKKIEDKN